MLGKQRISKGLWSLGLAALALAALLTGWGTPTGEGTTNNALLSRAYAQPAVDTNTPTNTPTDTPTPTATPYAPPGEPEFNILQYVVNNAGLYCQGPFGPSGHRYITNCYPFMYGSHPTNGYVDGYSDGSTAQAAWQTLRTSAQQSYPIFQNTTYGIYAAYDAGNTAFPYAHYESYFWGGRWVMGAVSSDDTSFRGSPVIANAILQAARALGYLGPPILTPTITPTATPTIDPTHLCDLSVRTVVISCNPDGTEHWTARVRNSGSWTVFDSWSAELQMKTGGNGPFMGVASQQGVSTFPPGDTVVSGDFPYSFPPSTSVLKVEFALDTFDRNCSPHARSGAIPVCAAP